MSVPPRVEYLHIAYLPQSGGWVLPIITEVRGAKSQQLQLLAKSWAKSDLSELGLAVTTKLAMLPHVIETVDQLLSQLCQEAEALNDLQEHIDKGAGFLPIDRELPYRVLAAIDMFIYEFRSTYEIVAKFVRKFSETFLGERLTKDKVTSLLRKAGIDDAWISDLKNLRVLFFHNTAPWLALEITARSPLRARLLVLRRNVTDLANTDEAITFERLRAIHTGLGASLSKLRQWLIARFRERDAALAGGPAST